MTGSENILRRPGELHPSITISVITFHENLGNPFRFRTSRPESDWKIYTHALDRDAILQKDNPLERLDIQLVRMIEDARDTLLRLGYPIKSRVLMTGFSASGTFTNRFSLIHPDRIYALAAGGLNGLLMLPVSKIDGTGLNYPLGTNDFHQLFKEPFDSSAFRTSQYFLWEG